VAKENIRQAAISEVIRLLRIERERQKMSMNQLAEHSGLSQSMISLLERGIRNPTLETLLRIADVLKIDLAKIIGKAIRSAAKGKSK
jgi:transcriptional regulator with XRE-family HTH domain